MVKRFADRNCIFLEIYFICYLEVPLFWQDSEGKEQEPELTFIFLNLSELFFYVMEVAK